MAKSNCKQFAYVKFRLHHDGDNMDTKERSKAKKNDKRKVDRSSWVIGGTTMIGIGVGFILLPISPLLLVASVLIGIGVGLVIVPFIPKRRG